MSTYYIPDRRDNDSRWEQMHGKMSENFRRTRMRNSTHYKNEQETEEAYCKGYEHGYEDAMKEMQGADRQTSEFKYGH